ncbi:carboxylesterase/lipase family protein [Tomitella gaofuii]|uniref:carboxylesterase/lipase family protein n=1 Tax=Tomitella gaofuii TaxID=2760083 RepID=UPI0015FCBE31|nr:carboxylesterase family protein [Tomitella gaofuii]
MDVVVETAAGAVRGVRSAQHGHAQHENGHGHENGHAQVTAFKGIPFAAPPYGENRFAPPQPVVPWEGVRDALDYGPTPPKPPYRAPIDTLLPEPSIPGEDVLNLNVWSPDTGSVGLPVLVWIHGGAFVNGTGAVPLYDGSAFARSGVVCVTVNYRLGAEGFALLPDAPGIAPANRGLLDQVAALEWVRDNIAAFGGDARRVTVAGESAGAMSVTALMAMPAADGLFQRAITQSGAGHHAMHPETARTVTAALAESLGVAATAEGLGTVPIAELIDAQRALSERIAAQPDPTRWGEAAVDGMAFEPCVDGSVLPGRPIDRIAGGAGASVGLLTGTNADEFALFTVPFGLDAAMTEAGVRGLAASMGLDADEAVGAYAAAGPALPPEQRAGVLFMALMRDVFFRIPAIRVVEARAVHGAGSFVYEFGWRSPELGGLLGAAHAMELGFVFDTLAHPDARPMTGPNPPQHLADAMHGAWVRFIESGHPGWDEYGARRTVRMFGHGSAGGGAGDGVGADGGPAVVDDPEASTRALWEGRR